uniref:keratin-associated protein 19-5-like n=1 Tax=Myodes glareolus TaxID=447135 RepID=UPI002021AE98|nr:keratin-associated protein 19-5-like [Myodes glareolus]
MCHQSNFYGVRGYGHGGINGLGYGHGGFSGLRYGHGGVSGYGYNHRGFNGLGYGFGCGGGSFHRLGNHYGFGGCGYGSGYGNQRYGYFHPSSFGGYGFSNFY